jgi:hypothetical protein
VPLDRRMSFVPGDLPAAEYEFFAENSIITIIPNLSLPRINLIQVRRPPRACMHAHAVAWMTVRAVQRVTCS